MTSAVKLKCRICNHETDKATVLTNKRTFYHCDNCNFTGLDPKCFLNSIEEKARYDLHENSIEDQGYVNMFNKFISYAIKPLEDIKTILDYGSGPGPVLAELLKRQGYQTSIYDPIYAKYQYSSESFDLISSTEVFEHFYNPLEEIQKLIELVKPGGYITIMTRFCPELKDFKSWFYKDDPTHVSLYTVKTFEFIAQKFKLKIIKHDDFQNIVLQKST